MRRRSTYRVTKPHCPRHCSTNATLIASSPSQHAPRQPHQIHQHSTDTSTSLPIIIHPLQHPSTMSPPINPTHKAESPCCATACPPHRGARGPTTSVTNTIERGCIEDAGNYLILQSSKDAKMHAKGVAPVGNGAQGQDGGQCRDSFFLQKYWLDPSPLHICFRSVQRVADTSHHTTKL